jgi:hypothetical protein
MSQQGSVWIAAGAVLDLAGAVLIARSLPQVGVALAAGIALLLAGSLMVFQGSLRIARGRARRPAVGELDHSEWRLEPELNMPPPRPVLLTRTGKLSATLWGAMILVVAGYVFLVPSIPARTPALLADEGAAATATVHAKNERDAAAGEKAYYLAFHFATDQGQQVRESRRVPRTVYDDLAVGDSFEVIYLSENPQLSFVPRIERQEIPPALRWGAVALLAALLVAFEQQRRFHKRVVAHGAAAAGVVEGVRRRGANRMFTVRYKLHGQEGTLRGSERNPARADGDVLTVLYLPERPERALLYRTSLYRARQ